VSDHVAIGIQHDDNIMDELRRIVEALVRDGRVDSETSSGSGNGKILNANHDVTSSNLEIDARQPHWQTIALASAIAADSSSATVPPLVPPSSTHHNEAASPTSRRRTRAYHRASHHLSALSALDSHSSSALAASSSHVIDSLPHVDAIALQRSLDDVMAAHIAQQAQSEWESKRRYRRQTHRHHEHHRHHDQQQRSTRRRRGHTHADIDNDDDATIGNDAAAASSASDPSLTLPLSFPTLGNAQLTWRHLSYSASGVARLQRVSGYVECGSMIAVVGAADAGATTLFSLLAQRQRGGHIHGEVMLNGLPVEEHRASRRTIAFAPKDDTHLPQLTVIETISMAAKLRCPATLPQAYIALRVDNIIKLLGRESIEID